MAGLTKSRRKRGITGRKILSWCREAGLYPWLFIVAVAGLVIVQSMWRIIEPADRLADTERLVGNFDRVVFDNEYDKPGPNNIRKWTKTLQVIVLGSGAKRWRSHVERHLDTLGRLSGLDIAYVTESYPLANFFIYIVKGDRWTDTIALHNRWLSMTSKDVERYSCVGFYRLREKEIRSAFVLISTESSDGYIASCLPGQLAHSLGMPGNSEFIRPSLFSEADDRLDDLSINDRVLVRALYDDRLTPGMPRDEAMAIVRDVIAELVAEARNGAAWAVAG